MNKKVVILLISLLVLAVAAGGGYLIVSLKNKPQTDSVEGGVSLTTKEEVTGDLEYEDSSGFSFKYPKNLRVEDVTPSDDSYYSKLSLTKLGGKLTITVKDESSKTIDELIKSDNYYGNASLIGATVLAGIPAKEYELGGKLLTIALKDGILYLIEANKDGGFWQNAQGVVVSSFKFGLTSSNQGTSSEANTVYEAEEIVE